MRIIGMIPFNIPPIGGTTTPTESFILGFIIEFILLGVPLYVAFHSITGYAPNSKKCGVTAFFLTGVKFIITYQIYNMIPEIRLSSVILFQTSAMIILLTLILLLLFKAQLKQAFGGALVILFFQYVLNVILNFLFCMPFFLPTNIETIREIV